MKLLATVCLAAVWLPWLVMVTMLVNRAVAEHRERKRQGRAMDDADRDFLRLCYVTLLLAVWLKGW